MALEQAIQALEGQSPVPTDKPANSDPGASISTQAKPAEKAPPFDEVSSKFAALAKKEKAIQRQAQEIAAERQRIKEMEAKYSKYDNLKGEVAKNPLKLLEEYGLSYKQLTDFILNDNKPTTDQEISSVRQELEMFKKAQEEERQANKQREEQSKQAQYQQAISEFKEEIGSYVAENEEKYELINLYKTTDVVYTTIEEHFQRTGKVLSMAEAADMVEDYLYNQVQMAQKAKKFAPKAADPKEDPRMQDSRRYGAAVENSPQAKTLTNQATSVSPTSLPAATEQDRIKRALARLG